jgi:hypothetical protein
MRSRQAEGHPLAQYIFLGPVALGWWRSTAWTFQTKALCAAVTLLGAIGSAAATWIVLVAPIMPGPIGTRIGFGILTAALCCHPVAIAVLARNRIR